MSTLTVMQGLLRERLGNPTTTDIPDATLTKRLNEAYEYIWGRYRFLANRSVTTTIATVSGTSGYTLSTSADVLRTVRDITNHVRLTKMSEDAWDSISAARGTETSPATAKPLKYYRQGTTLYLDPVPDGIYTIQTRFRSSYTAMTTGSDVPSIPSSWHFGMVLYARYLHWETLTDARMSNALSIFNAWALDQPNEFDDELQADAQYGFQPSTLAAGTSRLDFDHSDD